MNLSENFRLKRISYEKRKQQVLFLSYKFLGKSVRLNFTEDSIKDCEINQNNIIDILLNLKIRTDYLNFKPKHRRRNKFIYFCNDYVKRYRKNRLKLNKDLILLKSKMINIINFFKIIKSSKINNLLIKKYNNLREQIKPEYNESLKVGDKVIFTDKCPNAIKRRNIEMCGCGDDCGNKNGALDDGEIGIVRYVSNLITIENPFLLTSRYQKKHIRKLLFFESYRCIKKLHSDEFLTIEDIKEVNRVCSLLKTLIEKRNFTIKYFVENLKESWKKQNMEPSDSSLIQMCRFKNMLPLFKASLEKTLPNDLLINMRYNLNDIIMLERFEYISNHYVDVKECSICFQGVFDKIRTKIGDKYYCNSCLKNHFIFQLKSSKINSKGLSYPDASDYINPLKLKSTFSFWKKKNNLSSLISEWMNRLIVNTTFLCLCPNPECESKKKVKSGKYFCEDLKSLNGLKIRIKKKNHTIVDISKNHKCKVCKIDICKICHKHSTKIDCEFGKTLYELNKNKNTTLCPNCGRLVFRTEGCDHITCRYEDKDGKMLGCGADFCFKCGLLGANDFKCPGNGVRGHKKPLKMTEDKLKMLEI